MAQRPSHRPPPGRPPAVPPTCSPSCYYPPPRITPQRRRAAITRERRLARNPRASRCSLRAAAARNLRSSCPRLVRFRGPSRTRRSGSSCRFLRSRFPRSCSSSSNLRSCSRSKISRWPHRRPCAGGGRAQAHRHPHHLFVGVHEELGQHILLVHREDRALLLKC